jgi:hypothetical protein
MSSIRRSSLISITLGLLTAIGLGLLTAIGLGLLTVIGASFRSLPLKRRQDNGSNAQLIRFPALKFWHDDPGRAQLNFLDSLRIAGHALGIPHQHADPPHPLGLLRACRERPSSRRAAEQHDELASSHVEHGASSPALGPRHHQ